MKDTSFGKYKKAIRALPREIFNRQLFLTALSFALCGCPKGWDEGSAASITQLKSFQRQYDLDTELDSETIENLVSFVNIGAGLGAFLSFFVNDKLGRIQSMRLYQTIYVIGSLVSCFSYGSVAALYFGRVFAGLGIGACTVIGPMTLAEIAPATIRGFMTLWFNMCMLLGQALGIFVVFGCNVHISSSLSLQYQVPWFVQTFAPFIGVVCSFLIVESPRWLAIRCRQDDALKALSTLRGLPIDDPFVLEEYRHIVHTVEDEGRQSGSNSLIVVMKETFFVRSNLRRVQLTVIAYILAQFSGANSVTNYLPTIFGLIGVTGRDTKIYSSGLYAIAKFVCTMAASLFFVDMLGRRKSLMIGIMVQMLCHSYLSGYLNVFRSEGSSVPKGASDAAIAIIYVHAFGWAVGLYTLPYLFGAELWPNRIRSFGGALSQSFHWFFYFAITKATPSLLRSMNVWGAFMFFVGWCVIALVYTFFFIPETSGLSLDDMSIIFSRPIYKMRHPLPASGADIEVLGEKEDISGNSQHEEKAGK
ncbi:major facilitator superfamily transporter [Fusarium pseudocircinatum]|uniref:Major facilitator superfamily transporter n=1 Tax=Fusarium pseudocircinatum TaxID=56676 RepID=A0A8H5L0X7_9HYPO|nr:major facilitator superfamily transporter [Fusarium pseudocircinatum]